MDFRDKDGGPLIKWSTPEEAFNAWRECSRGRPCDYSGLWYAKLSGDSGIQWPCNEKFPNGQERLYADAVFNTAAEFCELFGHDLVTGAAIPAEKYRAADPQGRAIIKSAEHVRPPEEIDAEYPFLLTTGRLVYHWHTRTKTGRVRELQAAAPEPFVQISNEDALTLSIAPEISSKPVLAEEVSAPARVGEIPPGEVFIPFHYGYWDTPGTHRAANELTITGWDPVSKQPLFKYAAVNLTKCKS